MQNELSKSLRAARALISEPGTNIKFVGYKYLPEGRTAFCANGALQYVGYFNTTSSAIFAVLKRRFEAGTLPTPTFSGGRGAPIPWGQIMNKGEYVAGHAIAQFNNSTDQEQVLALFDEAIADAEGDEGHPAAPAAPEKPQPEAPPVPKPVSEPVQPAARQRVLELA